MKNLTVDIFNNEILKNKNDLFIIKFESDFCMQCVAIKPTLNKLEQEYPNVNFYNANIRDVNDIANNYNILSLPTLIFFKNGKEINRLIGNLPKVKFNEEINKTL